MWCLGKLNGPECRTETIMDVFLLPFIFLIRAVISFLLLFQALLQAFSSRQDIIRYMRLLLKITQRGIQQLIQWIGLILWLFVSSYSGCFWLQILRWIFIVPVTFITFFWYVYDFGPKHRKQSFFDILSNPVPGIEFDGRIGESSDFDSLERRCFNHNFIAWKIARDKHLSSKWATGSSTALVHDCPIAHINNAAPIISGYQTYTTFHK